MALNLTAERALIFRITHRDNIPWILDHGLHCQKSNVTDPRFVSIGQPELIDKRRDHIVPCPPGGTLGDYVPFYFTPCSPMLYNIVTGWRGLRRREREEIVVLMSSLHSVVERGIAYLFTDRHALLVNADYCSGLADLARLDWERLRNRDFKYNSEEPDKVDRYQAEALVYGSLPTDGLLGLVCYNDSTVERVKRQVQERELDLKVAKQASWFM